VLHDITSSQLHPLLASRWSPTTFDQSHVVTASDVEVLLEAARWAPSAGNSQPWAFIVGRRGDRTHDRLSANLAGSSARWAPTASLLVANLSHRFVEGTDWDYSEFAVYDLGQAVAHMTVQARALGLHVRQFRAFDRAGVAAEFAVPAHWEVTTMSAIGRVTQPTDVEACAGSHEDARRQRRPVEDLVWPTMNRDRRGDPAPPAPDSR
jgi:nitroreductase